LDVSERNEGDRAEVLWRELTRAMRYDGDPDEFYSVLARRDRLDKNGREFLDDLVTALCGMNALELWTQSELMSMDVEDMPFVVSDDDETPLNF
jgi:hypothetical protein